MEEQINGRRARIYSLASGELIRMLNWWKDCPISFVLPMFDALPDDARVTACMFNYETNCEDFLVTSEEFDCIPDGEELPRVMARVVAVAAKRNTEVPACGQ